MNGTLLAGDCVAEIDGVSVRPSPTCAESSPFALDI